MSITIQPELEAKLRSRAEAEGITVEAYLEQVVRNDEEAEEELEVLALAGLDSGPSITPSEEYWEEKYRRLVERRQAVHNP